MDDIIKQIGLVGLIPVIKIDRVEDALPLSQALIAGNLPIAEITFRTDAAEKAIEAIAKGNPSMLVGAGTVLTTEQADRAIGSGAQYIVSPGFNPIVVEHCLKKGVPITPGVTNPSLVEQAASMGLKVLKFFPAEQSGGLDMIQTFASVYPSIKFIPTGGISEKNLLSYVKAPNIHAVGGSWMVTPDLITRKQWDTITTLSKEAITIVHSFSLAYVGFTTGSEENAQGITNLLANLFDMKTTNSNAAIFVTTSSANQYEVTSKPCYGNRGDIGIRCNNIIRAKDYLSKKGVYFIEESRSTQAIYLQEQIGGFALHLLQ